MRFFRDSCVSPVLDSSCMSFTRKFDLRGFLAFTKKITIFRGALNYSHKIHHIFSACTWGWKNGVWQNNLVKPLLMTKKELSLNLIIPKKL